MSDESDVPRERLVQEKRAPYPVQVVEAEGVRVVAHGPNEHDVMHKGAAVVRRRRYVDGAHTPAVSRHPTNGADALPGKPGGTVYDLGVVR